MTGEDSGHAEPTGVMPAAWAKYLSLSAPSWRCVEIVQLHTGVCERSEERVETQETPTDAKKRDM